MKKIIVLFIFKFQFTSLLIAQSGDFSLPPGNRAYLSTSSNQRVNGSTFTKFLIGKNYRREWLDSIDIPVLNFTTDYGGLTAIKEGGGKQTRSLHLKDSSGGEWVIRSIQKYPEKIIAPEVRGTIAEKLIRDGISGSYPYGSLSVGTLAKNANLPYFPNTLIYITDDTALGKFRQDYKNTVALLELRSIGEKGNEKQYDTQEMFPELLKSGDNRVDETALLRLRLFDNFIMDFDRHEGQWSWIKKDSAGLNYFVPIPKDRDQAFFRLDGFLLKLLKRNPVMGPLQGFNAKAKNINSFNYSERNLDRAFLTRLDEKTWETQIDQFLETMTDATIESALKKQPEKLQQGHVEKIIQQLKKRRNYFKKEMMKYYRFLSETVTVTGTNNPETFFVTRNNDGSTTVIVETLEKGRSDTIYERSFDPAVTKELRLYGLEGKDRFVVTGDNDKIRIRLIGGPGEDTFTNEGKGKKILAYDVSFEPNIIAATKGIKNKINDDPLNNQYNRLDHTYDRSAIAIAIEYSLDGGLFLGPRYMRIRTGFRKEPFASKQVTYLTRNLNSPSYHFYYNGTFVKLVNNTDLLVLADLKFPTVRTNFFGYGNNSIHDQSKELEYYHAHYTIGDLSILGRNQLTPWLQIFYGPAFQYFNFTEDRNSDKYINKGYVPESGMPLNSNGRWFAGAEVKLSADTRNSELIPTRGIYANIYSKPLLELSPGNNKLNQVGSDFAFYTGLFSKKHLVLASGFGVNHNIGDFDIPQAQYLGFKQNLRGYRYQRFAGRTAAYNNTELRVNFGNVNFYVFKGPFGVLGFHDVGRVWIKGKSSDTWHTGYGGGIWAAPYNKLVLTASVCASKEEKLFPMASIGFQF